MIEFFAFILLAIPFWWPLIMILAIGLTIHAAVTFFRRDRRRMWIIWAEASAVTACITVLTYGAGFIMGGFFHHEPEDPCIAQGYGYSNSVREPSSLWPLSNPLCTSGSGVVDLVPAFVNPVIYISIGLFAACTIIAVAARRASS